ncbi:hypothetical protein OPT61_g2865 [Boeremia exigua]|uniref:Uncharacterized protein n=1 Tax=Boeremia exigua TaxID=749465 RepID=A0ACC2IK60_9PLEO|nr:hypothetical protein OPT61_g2865 [Boeremia exigua]
MKFSTSAVLLAGASSVLAGPALLPRAITGPTKGYICDVDGKDVSFTQTYITKAITSAAATKATVDILKELPQCDLSSTHARDLAFCQPKKFNNHPVPNVGTLSFPKCTTGPWYEFPLISDGKTVYAGPKAPGTANPSRVIFQYTNANTAKFCGAVMLGEKDVELYILESVVSVYGRGTTECGEWMADLNIMKALNDLELIFWIMFEPSASGTKRYRGNNGRRDTGPNPRGGAQ